MAKLRCAKAYRRVKRAYTRTSRVKSKAYIKGAPYQRIAQFDMGQTKNKFSHEVQLVATKHIQLRDNALEAARQTAVKYLEVAAAKEGFAMKLRVVPHHIIRENPTATGAGADRFKMGMTLAFGNPIGHACQVYPGKVIFSIYVNKDGIELAKEALRKANSKFPIKCSVNILEKNI